MDHPTVLRNKFWFVFFALFVFWYFLLYGFDWSSLPGLTSISINLDKSIQSLSLRSQQQISVDDDNNIVKDDVIIKTADFDVNTSDDAVVTSGAGGDSTEILVPEIKQERSVNSSCSNNDDEDIEGDENDTCRGRYIYVHDLPRRYNQDLLKQCKLFSKWNDMCPSLTNMGLGPELGNPQRVFLNRGWFNTQQFNLEVIFHNRMKQYDCLTNDSSKASAIYVPYYAGLDVSRYLWSPYNGSVKDSDSLDLVKWLRSKPEWGRRRMWGKDHFLVAGRITWDFRRGISEEDDPGWGNNLMRLPESENMTMLTIESSPWHRNDFAIPYPTYFHPSTDEDVLLWQNKIRRQKRRTLFCFAGAPRPNMVDSIRDEIMAQCEEAASRRRKCRLLECKNDKNKCNKPVYLMKLFQTSTFCLQPSGDSFTRRSTFDSILAGCIPVFFTPASAYVQYLWHLPNKDFSKYSVLIPEDDVKKKNVSIEDVLSRIPRSKVSDMREEVIKLIPNVIYADPRSKLHKFKDAFDLTVEGVIRRVETLKKEIKEGGSATNFDEESSWKYYTFGTVDEHEWDSFFLRTPRDRY